METIKVSLDRYEELIAKEERLHTMETAIKKLSFYDRDFELFKNMFDLGGKKDE